MNNWPRNKQFPTRVLICGLGSIGRRHVRILHQFWPELELAVLRTGQGLDCPELGLVTQQFHDLDLAISWKPDAAVISTPAPFHQSLALHLARLDIPVLIEKPLGVGDEPQEGWSELQQLSHHLTILVGYVLRHDPCTNFIKDRLGSGFLGKILEADFYCGSWLPDWRPLSDYRTTVSSQRSMGGGALLELSHEIDLARFILGDYEILYSTLHHSGLLDVDVEDHALLVGQGPGSSLLTFRLNFCTIPARRNIVIRCEHGEINWDILSGESKIFLRTGLYETYKSDSTPDERYRLQLSHFFQCITGNETPHCTFNDGMQVLCLVNQARNITGN